MIRPAILLMLACALALVVFLTIRLVTPRELVTPSELVTPRELVNHVPKPAPAASLPHFSQTPASVRKKPLESGSLPGKREMPTKAIPNDASLSSHSRAQSLTPEETDRMLSPNTTTSSLPATASRAQQQPNEVGQVLAFADGSQIILPRGVQMPAALGTTNKQELPAKEKLVEQLANDFGKEIQDISQQSTGEAEFAEAWELAKKRSDARYRILFGDQAFIQAIARGLPLE